jgi:pimeloyl-ACP methyl ester carboxylesterase
MKTALAAILTALWIPLASAQSAPAPVSGPVDTPYYATHYVKLASPNAEGLLYEPTGGAKPRIALLFSHPSGNNFADRIGPQLARRGYRILMVNYRGTEESDDAYLPSISDGVSYLRTLSGVEKVVVIGHSGGGHLIAMYQSVAEQSVDSCRRPEQIWPCSIAATSLAKADGVVLLDPTLGAFHQMSSLDPAAGGDVRAAALDMFAPVNGNDRVTGRAVYTPAFRRRFYAAQAARNARLVARARALLTAIEAGKGEFSDDAPMIVPGMGVTSTGARLYQPDISIVSRTKAPHVLLRADGSETLQIIRSVRPVSGQQSPGQLRSLSAMTRNTTARRFLASSAIRTLPGYSFTEDDIVGVDWRSAFSATPSTAEGITVPTLVMPMSCHYLLVPGEIIFDHLAARDKSIAVVEGATHLFAPCRPEYGDTLKRTFDHVGAWLSAGGRF